MKRQRLFPPLALERAMAAPSPHSESRQFDKRSSGTLGVAELKRLVAAMIG